MVFTLTLSHGQRLETWMNQPFVTKSGAGNTMQSTVVFQKCIYQITGRLFHSEAHFIMCNPRAANRLLELHTSHTVHSTEHVVRTKYAELCKYTNHQEEKGWYFGCKCVLVRVDSIYTGIDLVYTWALCVVFWWDLWQQYEFIRGALFLSVGAQWLQWLGLSVLFHQIIPASSSEDAGHECMA